MGFLIFSQPIIKYVFRQVVLVVKLPGTDIAFLIFTDKGEHLTLMIFTFRFVHGILFPKDTGPGYPVEDVSGRRLTFQWQFAPVFDHFFVYTENEFSENFQTRTSGGVIIFSYWIN